MNKFKNFPLLATGAGHREFLAKSKPTDNVTKQENWCQETSANGEQSNYQSACVNNMRLHHSGAICKEVHCKKSKFSTYGWILSALQQTKGFSFSEPDLNWVPPSSKQRVCLIRKHTMSERRLTLCLL